MRLVKKKKIENVQIEKEESVYLFTDSEDASSIYPFSVTSCGGTRHSDGGGITRGFKIVKMRYV